ncbi:gfo/Idh/MocA family oxidoreductase [Candidatus Poribacteria bacterium]|nr:gfo/Idh/MocA family oxidoreductase [Candidatus Poribacteria bacterium]
MDKKVKWGILGPGNIANQFAKATGVIPDAELTAVGSRSMERANKFADKYDIPKRFGSYEDLANDPDVEAIYVATPHPFHKEYTILCLKAGKAVLCEKPFAVNTRQVKEMIECAKTEKVFLMEAMWTRFLPIMVKVREWIADGVIGEPRMLTADFGFRSGLNPEGRLFNPELAGGGLLDVGVYTVAMAYMIFGEPACINSMAHIGETGVDEQAAMVFGYDKGQIAMLSCAIRTSTPQEARIMGTEGSIYLPGFWHGTSAVLQVSGKEPQNVDMPFKGNGYEYEVMEVMKCLEERKLESNIVPLSESLAIMKTLDEIREQWKLKYPFEE